MKRTKQVIQKTVDSLRKEAAAKIKEANELEASIPQTEHDRVVKKLHRQFKKLEEGFEVKWHPTSRPITPVITSTVEWQSDVEPEFDQNINYMIDRALEDWQWKLHEEWEEWIKKHPKVVEMRKEIKALCDQSDAYAKKFGVEGGEFFGWVMDGESQ